jgi:hypothetical protein
MNETLPMTNAQLELSFGGLRVRPTPANTRRPTIHNAQWWFQRMRQIVNSALDWQPATPPRPEQIDLPGRDFRYWTA